MHNLFAEFGLFLWGVAQQYVTLAAGCAITVMIDLLAKHWLKRPLSYREDVAILGVFVFLACFLAWRQEYERASGIGQGTAVQVNIPQQAPPQVNVNVPPAVVNIPAQMAYMSSTDVAVVAPSYKIGGNWAITQTFKNISPSVVAEDAAIIQEVKITDTTRNFFKQPIVPVANQDQFYKQFQKDISDKTPQQRTYGPGESGFATAFSATIDDQLDNDFRDGSKTILFFSKATWRDATGKHESDVCKWLQLSP